MWNEKVIEDLTGKVTLKPSSADSDDDDTSSSSAEVRYCCYVYDTYHALIHSLTHQSSDGGDSHEGMAASYVVNPVCASLDHPSLIHSLKLMLLCFCDHRIPKRGLLGW